MQVWLTYHNDEVVAVSATSDAAYRIVPDGELYLGWRVEMWEVRDA